MDTKSINGVFPSYTSKGTTFDSFNGTELKCWFKITTAYDEFGQSSSFELIEMGTISAFSDTMTFDNDIVLGMGNSHPIGIATGDKLVVGTMKFEILNKGFIGQINQVLKEAGITHTEIITGTDGTYSIERQDIKEINEFPLIDIVLIGIKENDQNKKIQKEIKGLRFTSGSSAIGLNQLGTGEVYQYMAQTRSDWKPVVGTSSSTDDTNGSSVDFYTL